MTWVSPLWLEEQRQNTHPCHGRSEISSRSFHLGHVRANSHIYVNAPSSETSVLFINIMEAVTLDFGNLSENTRHMFTKSRGRLSWEALYKEAQPSWQTAATSPALPAWAAARPPWKHSALRPLEARAQDRL